VFDTRLLGGTTQILIQGSQRQPGSQGHLQVRGIVGGQAVAARELQGVGGGLGEGRGIRVNLRGLKHLQERFALRLGELLFAFRARQAISNPHVVGTEALTPARKVLSTENA
jgi:hypothetical protein